MFELNELRDHLGLCQRLAVIVGEIAMKSGVPELEVAADLHGLIARRQQTDAED